MEQTLSECNAMSIEELEKLLDDLYDRRGYAEDDGDEDLYTDLDIDITEVSIILRQRYKK